MGIFRQRVTVANPGTRQATQVECMVDTGSTYLWLPEDLLRSLGVQPLLGRRLKLATGQVIERDRKSTRLNSSHSQISYAVFCLKKKTNNYYIRYHDEMQHITSSTNRSLSILL